MASGKKCAFSANWIIDGTVCNRLTIDFSCAIKNERRKKSKTLVACSQNHLKRRSIYLDQSINRKCSRRTACLPSDLHLLFPPHFSFRLNECGKKPHIAHCCTINAVWNLRIPAAGRWLFCHRFAPSTRLRPFLSHAKYVLARNFNFKKNLMLDYYRADRRDNWIRGFGWIRSPMRRPVNIFTRSAH